MTTIHLINSEMGGMGKSLFCSLLYEYCQQSKKNIQIDLIDVDRSFPDVGIKYLSEDYEKGAFIYFSDNEREWHRTDDLYERALKTNLLINLPPKISPIFDYWMENNQVLKLSVESEVYFANWFLTNGSYNSILFFKKFVNQYKNNITHILVRNGGLCNNWENLENDAELNALISKYKIKSLLIPALNSQIKYSLDRNKMSFIDALKSSEFNPEQKNLIKLFLNEVFARIENTSIGNLL